MPLGATIRTSGAVPLPAVVTSVLNESASQCNATESWPFKLHENVLGLSSALSKPKSCDNYYDIEVASVGDGPCIPLQTPCTGYQQQRTTRDYSRAISSGRGAIC